MRQSQNSHGIRRFQASLGRTAFSPHRHDVYTLGLTLRGVQCFNYRGAGQLVVLHPDELHDGHAGTAGGFAYRAITIQPSAISSLLPGRALPFIEGGQSANPGLLQAVSTALSHPADELAPLQEDEALFDIATALHAASGQAAPGGRLDARASERARSYIHEHLDQPVSMDDLEQATGQDRWQLSRDFRRLHGTSPYRYLLMRRLDAARDRIQRGESIAQTALACGFNDQSHMTRHFKAVHGLSPFRWKRSVTPAARDACTIVQD